MKYGYLFALLFGLVASGVSAQDSTQLQRACDDNQCVVSDVTRVLITPNIVHVSATLKVGSGAYDKIRIHRVVKIGSNGIAKPNLKGVFAAHPEPLNFDATFLHGYDANNTAGSSIAVYLAQNNIDVWGYDRRQALVPPTVPPTALSFMAGWNLETDADDARVSIQVARVLRGLTGSGVGKMKFLGYSRGGQIGYVLLQKESQMLPVRRSVDGFIPIDILMKTQDPYVISAACASSNLAATELANGIYSPSYGLTVLGAAGLAAGAPNDPSPFFPGLTNYQVLVGFGGATFLFGESYTPYYHLAAPVLANGFPVGLLYTDPDALLKTMLSAAPYGSQGAIIQGDGVACANTPLDDHLHDIKVPVMYVGTQGGLGDLGYYTLTLLGSTDITKLNISLSANPYEDFGHDDVLRAELAKTLVWQPVLNWLQAH